MFNRAGQIMTRGELKGEKCNFKPEQEDIIHIRMSIIRPWKQNMVANFFSYFNNLKKNFHWYRSTGKSSKNIPVLCIAMRAFYGFILALPIR